MDVFERIMREHREIEMMLQQLSDGYDAEVFNRLERLLAAHMRAEEASLYPAMSEREGEMVQHAAEEHRGIGNMLAAIGRSSKEGDAFIDGIEELTSLLDDHILEEEEEMIPMAKQMFDRYRIDELSSKFDEVDERITQRAA